MVWFVCFMKTLAGVNAAASIITGLFHGWRRKPVFPVKHRMITHSSCCSCVCGHQSGGWLSDLLRISAATWKWPAAGCALVVKHLHNRFHFPLAMNRMQFWNLWKMDTPLLRCEKDKNEIGYIVLPKFTKDNTDRNHITPCVYSVGPNLNSEC